MAKPNESIRINYDDPKYRITLSQQGAASCFGAFVTSLIMTPLDVVKIRLQTQQKKVVNKCFLYCDGLMDHICSCQPTDPNNPWFKRPIVNEVALARNFWLSLIGNFCPRELSYNLVRARQKSTIVLKRWTSDAFIKISKNEGVTSLWSGLSPTLVLSIPATICYFVTYEQLRLKIKEIYNRKNNLFNEQPFWIPLVSGATARIVSVTLVNPLELIRTKMQSQTLSSHELRDALKALIKSDGILGLWKGIYPTLLRDVPFSAIYWTTYETLKLVTNAEQGRPTFWQSFGAGAAAGSIAASVTIPFDVVKTQQQIEFGTNLFSENGQKLAPRTTSMIFRDIYNQYGLRGFFAGLTPRLIKVAPACAIMISSFEYGKIFFNKLNNKEFSSSSSSTNIQEPIIVKGIMSKVNNNNNNEKYI